MPSEKVKIATVMAAGVFGQQKLENLSERKARLRRFDLQQLFADTVAQFHGSKLAAPADTFLASFPAATSKIVLRGYEFI